AQGNFADKTSAGQWTCEKEGPFCASQAYKNATTVAVTRKTGGKKIICDNDLPRARRQVSRGMTCRAAAWTCAHPRRPHPSTRIAYRDGIALSVMEGDYLRPLAETSLEVAAALAGRRVPVAAGFVGR